MKLKLAIALMLLPGAGRRAGRSRGRHAGPHGGRGAAHPAEGLGGATPRPGDGLRLAGIGPQHLRGRCRCGRRRARGRRQGLVALQAGRRADGAAGHCRPARRRLGRARSIAYETSPSEKAVRSRSPCGRGRLDGDDRRRRGSHLNKRSGATSLLQESLRPAGYARETFAGKAAHRLTPERIQALRDFVAQSARRSACPASASR